MGSLDKRLSRLERAFSRGGDGREPGGEGRRFVSGVLRAVGHVRREPIDRGRPYGYNAAILEDLHPHQLAQYAAALRLLEHPDAEEARAFLADRGEYDLLRLVDNVVGRVGDLRGSEA